MNEDKLLQCKLEGAVTTHRRWEKKGDFRILLL